MNGVGVAQITTVLSEERCLLAHDLNNKLAVIVGQCELLSEHTHDPECVARLQTIAQAAKLMADAVNGHQCQIAGIVRTRSERS